jgi:hypothetical protein
MSDLVQRSCTFDLSARAEGMDENVVPVVISTDAPVPMVIGGKRVNEILDHKPESVDLSRFPLPLVEDHDNARTALAIVEDPRPEGGKLRGMMRFGSQVRAKEILADVRSGIIRSLSVFYERMTSVRENDETIRTVKWLPVHVSPVGAPADTGAGFFRSENPTPPSAVAPRNAAMTEPVNPEPKPVAPVAPVIDVAALRAEAKEIAGIARSLELPADDYVGMTKADATAAMLKSVGERAAKGKPDPAAPVVTITMDHADKQVDAVTEAFQARAGFVKAGNGNPYAGRSLTGIAQRYAKAIGIRAAGDWERKDIAHFILGELSQVAGARDAANISTASFPSFVMLNAMTKTVAKGFEMAKPTLVSSSGAPIYETQRVPDFKTFYVGGLGTANLQETAENAAFPELDKTEGVYSDTVKMWGGTLSLSLQALINDDTASFDRSLRQAGAIAQKTIDRRLIQKFLRGTATTDASTWTSNTTSGATPVYTTSDLIAAARANIGKANKDLQLKVGLDGNPIGNMAKFYLAGPTAGLYLSGLLNQAPGQVVGNSGNAELIVSPWLEATTITGYSTTSYYVVADPAIVTGLILSLISGYETPQVQEYDAGAVGARKWKIWMPAEADLFWFTNKAGTKIIPGAQQATT